MAGSLRFLIIQDHKENRRKCTLAPLEGRDDFGFLRLRAPREARGAQFAVGSGVLLHLDGEPLTKSDRGLLELGPLVVADSTWARLPSVLSRLKVAPGARLVRRSLPDGIRTAYPRASKLHRDPPAGLASIEALFAATVILGEPRLDLLRNYHWAGSFLQLNQAIFRDFARRGAGLQFVVDFPESDW